MKNTTLILQQLRLLMLNASIVGPEYLSAYIVPSSDAHHNIRRADCDQRLAYVSGFDGSSGTAIITADSALLWTDARYYTQAEKQIDDNWTLMKDGLDGTPSQAEWLRDNLPFQSNVGVDPTLYSRGEWSSMLTSLNFGNIILTPTSINLVDISWGDDRPLRPTNAVIQLPTQFTGKPVEEKLIQIREDVVNAGGEVLVITELDEIAWLLNLRGTDLPEAPTFFAFAILSEEEIQLFIERSKLSDVIVEDLVAVTNGSIEFHPYENISAELQRQATTRNGKFYFSKNCNFALTSVVDESRHIIAVSPIALRKAIKNWVEIDGMKKALIREAATLCQFYYWLEVAMEDGENVSEVSAASKLLDFKRTKENFVSLSFKTISASGPNGAIVHYFPTNETNRRLLTEEMYLIDSGSHYFDGTTDITRTFHFGTPSDHQRDCYTRVLKGQIAIAMVSFPNKTPGHAIDALARQYLWEAGYDYGHGTGHGVGAYLNVGEGPQSINSNYNPDDPGLTENMVISNEPGYYEEGNFGIRLENMIRVVTSSVNSGFLEMEDMVFVPYQHKLIKIDLLTEIEIEYLNAYQEKCRQIVGRFIIENDLGIQVYEWLLKETEPIIPFP